MRLSAMFQTFVDSVRLAFESLGRFRDTRVEGM